MKLLKILNSIGRSLEFFLTGQTDFKITTSEFETADIIDNEVQAKMALKEVREYLRGSFSIVLARPVVLHLGTPKMKEWKWQMALNMRHLGNCSSSQIGDFSTHSIVIVPGLERQKFKAVLCHELAHAFQAEHGMLRHLKGYREGMSRWVEYHFWLDSGNKKEAQKLKRISLAIFGNMLHKILNYEEKEGRAAACRWLASMDPDEE